MGRQSKPIDLIVMEGKTHKTKEEIRLRREREQALSSGSDRVDCPDWLCDVGRAEFKRLESDLINLGLLTNLDVNQLAIYCDAYAKYVDATTEIDRNGLVIESINKMGVTNFVTSPYVQIAAKYAEIVKKYCDEFGLSPSSRARMAIPKKGEDQSDPKEERIRGLI